MSDEFFRLFDRIKREMDRIFKEIEESFWEEYRPMFDIRSRCLEPLAYVNETEDEIIVTVDLPYVKDKNDIDVRISENELIIEARMKRPVKYSTLAGVYHNVSFDTYRKIIKLPSNIEPSEARARFKNGILEIRIPKKVRKFRINVE